MKITYEIDSMDWTSGHDDRAKCVDALGEWFEGLSLKNQLGIFYAQQFAFTGKDNHEMFDPMNDGCPFQMMVFEAQARIIKKYADWIPGTGFNLALFTVAIEREEVEA